MARIRTFLAVELSATVVKSARKLIARLAQIDSGVRWVDDDTMHITLQFLGDVEELEIAEVCVRMVDVAGAIEPFAIEIAGLGAFPNLARPRTLWAGVGDGHEELCALQQAIESELLDMRFPREKRRYQPHLTLGRARSDHGMQELSNLMNELADYRIGACGINEIIVFSSDLTASGPIYTRMGSAELG